jgi:nitroreductase
MDFFEVLEERRSIRKFKDRKVEDEKLIKILKAANSAPSAGNLQAYEIFLTRDKKKKKLIARASYNQGFIEEADVVLIFCAKPSASSRYYGQRGEKLYCLQDATIAASYAQLAATALGLGSVWIGAFNDEEVLKIIGNPKGLIPIAILPIGYPDENPRKRERRKLEDLVHEV